MAAHSPLLDPVLDTFEQFIRSTVTLHPPQRPVVSSMTGHLVTTELTDPTYWRTHLRNPVRFVEGVQTLAAEGATIFIEIGPKPTLLGMVEPSLEATHPAAAGQGATPILLSSLRQHEDEWRQMLTTLGELYVRGFRIAWPGVVQDAAAPRRKCLLPTYPFQRERYWIEHSKGKRSTTTLRPLIDHMMKSPLLKATLFETAVNTENLPFLTDHRVYGTIVAPGACHLAMVLSAAELAFSAEQSGADTWRYELSEVIFPQALAVEENETRTAQLIFKLANRNGAGPHADFELISFATAQHGEEDLSSQNHASGKVGLTRQGRAESVTLADLQARFTQPVTALPASRIEREGAPLFYGPAFQWLEAAWQLPTPATEQPTAALARLRRPDVVTTVAGYPLHPGLLDSCFQMTALVQTMTPQSELCLPFAVAEMHFAGSATVQAESDPWWCYTEQIDALKWNLWIFTNTGHCLALIKGFELRVASPAAVQTTRLRTDWLYHLSWEAAPLPQRTTSAPDGWLIFDQAAGLGGTLAAVLPTSSTSASPFTLLVQPGYGFAIHSQQQVTVDPTDPTSFRQLLAYVATRSPTANATVGVVYLWGLADSAADPAQQALTLTGGLLHLTQAFLAAALTARLWVVTESCQSLPQAPTLIEGRERQTDPASVAALGALWGLGRTLGRELPELQTVCLDLERDATPAQQIDLLRQELLAGVDALPSADGPFARQVTYRSGTRYVAGLQPWQAPARVDAAHPMRVQFNDYGGPDQITLAPMTRRQPGRDEIEVEVQAAGLNFRDVLNMLGMMKEYYAAALGITQAREVMVGFECAGTVTAVGADVTAFAVGDRVMGLGLHERTFASYVTVPALQMAQIPPHLSVAEAATIPLTFLTAWYGLIELAKLQPGEWILIHAASGGVGQAAVQIALAMGAQVIATASPGKWHLLQRQGVVQTLNSRTVDFAAAVLQVTGGRGVDVVLNSLNGDFIEPSLAALAQRGRFVEVGKLGIWSQAAVAERRPDVAYYPFDLGEEILGEPELQTRLWAAVTAQLQAGVLQPLPYRTFPVYEIRAAFRFMQQAKQFGKLVITFPQRPPSIRSDATYLITGGLGALGLEVAKQLVSAGAKYLVLTGRRGVTTEKQRTTLTELAEAGATVQIVSVDIGHGEAVSALLHTCQQSAPLRGILHAAGLLDDGVVPAQTIARLADVMRPKVDGSWHLHQATQTLALDFFICFSSSSALLGSPGQSNYTAANAFMDTLMQQRRQQGQPGLSINWGPWANIGMAVGLEKQMQAQGLLMISPQQGRLLLQYLLQQPVAQVGVVPLQTQRSPEIEELPKTQPLHTILATLPSQERKVRLEAFVRSMITTVLGLRQNSTLEMDTRLFDFGLDSLMAVELKNKLAAGLDCPLRSTLLFDYPTLDALLPHLLHDVLQLPDDTGVPSTQKETDDLAQIAAVQELSQEDLLSLLNAEIEDIL
jgi:NADPH:quinone reductase-like Zn-dependent oxidoreductase/acyl carrier protein